MAMVTRLRVKRSAFDQAEIAEAALPRLEDGEVLARIERFALTANNITYAAAGDMIGYWKFFPDEGEWGQVPVWGFAVIEDSRHSDVPVGARIYGYFPMASHVVLRPGRASDRGFTDASPHRADLPLVYNQYQRTEGDPPALAAVPDLRCLLFPLLFTGYLIGDYLEDNAAFGTDQLLIGSASSKTGIAAAHHAKSLATRPLEVVGLTSARNRDFTVALGIYDRVVTYDELETLDAARPTAFVDMSGDGGFIARVHHHFADALKASIGVGLTHWDSPRAAKDLPGATPEFFFAPAQIAKRQQQWGPGVLETKMGEANMAFLPSLASHLKIERHEGGDAAKAAYESMVNGRTPADAGVILAL